MLGFIESSMEVDLMGFSHHDQMLLCFRPFTIGLQEDTSSFCLVFLGSNVDGSQFFHFLDQFIRYCITSESDNINICRLIIDCYLTTPNIIATIFPF